MGKYDFSGLMEETGTSKSDYKYDFSGLMEEKPKKVEEKKKAWSIQTPEELIGKGYSPTSAGLIATGQQLSSPAWKFGNMLLGGLPNVALSKMGYEAPESQIRMGGSKNINVTPVVDAAANIGGVVRGLPMQAAKGAASIIPAAKVGSGIMTKVGLGAAKGAATLGLGSALHTPEDQFENWRGRVTRGAGGAAVGTITGGLGGLVSHFTGLLSQEGLLDTGSKTRVGYKSFKKKMTDSFEKSMYEETLKNPGVKVDVSDNLKSLPRLMEDSRKVKTLVNASPKLRKAMIGDGKLSLRQTQDLVNELKSSISENKLSGFKIRPSDKEVLQFVNSLQNKKHAAFPGMVKADNIYGEMSQYSKAVGNYMKYGKTSQGIKTMVNNPELRESLKQVLPKDTYNAVIQTAKAQNLGKEGIRTLDTLVRYGILYKFMNSFTKKINLGGDSGLSD